MMRFLVLMVLSAALTGCAGFIQTSTTIYHGPEHERRDSIAITPIDQSQQSSLEFEAVKKHLAQKLKEKGYEVTNNPNPKFTAFITYGIDDGKTRLTSVPIYGRTGGGTSYSSGTISGYGGLSTFSGTTTTMPTYGFVGSQTISSKEYKRKVNVDIWLNDKTPRKVYEMRGVSSGSCGNINSILFGIIDGMFKVFPGESGKIKTTTVEWNGTC